MRTILQMTTLIAIRHIPAIRDFHSSPRMYRQGTPQKGVLVAAMRKLLIVLNAVVRDQISWQSCCVITAE